MSLCLDASVKPASRQRHTRRFHTLVPAAIGEYHQVCPFTTLAIFAGDQCRRDERITSPDGSLALGKPHFQSAERSSACALPSARILQLLRNTRVLTFANIFHAAVYRAFSRENATVYRALSFARSFYYFISLCDFFCCT